MCYYVDRIEILLGRQNGHTHVLITIYFIFYSQLVLGLIVIIKSYFEFGVFHILTIHTARSHKHI